MNPVVELWEDTGGLTLQMSLSATCRSRALLPLVGRG